MRNDYELSMIMLHSNIQNDDYLTEMPPKIQIIAGTKKPALSGVLEPVL